MTDTFVEFNKILKNCKFNNKHITIIFDENNKPWFRAITVVDMLEYSDPIKTIKDYVEEVNKMKHMDITKTKNLIYNDMNSIFINKDGIFSLISSSEKEVAKRFKKWLISEILPLINIKDDIKEIYDIIDNLSDQFEN